jgi:y4mF family transcriptional regulator
MTSKVFGQLIRERRKKLGMNQADLALVSGTGLRFISDLENGKDSCQTGRAFRVLASLGLITTIDPKEK